MSKPITVKGTGYQYEESLYDYHGGQHNGYAVIANRDGKIIAKLDFALYKRTLYVQHIEVSPAYRRIGLGTALISQVKRSYPEYRLDPGMMTDSGAAFFKSL